MEMLTNAIKWAEIPVSDFDRAKKFYSTIYDFEMPEMMMGPNRMGFLLFDQNGGIGAAIQHGPGNTPSPDGVRLYLNGGNDLTKVLLRVEQAGGKILVPKIYIGPGLGHFATFRDTEGNHVSLHSDE